MFLRNIRESGHTRHISNTTAKNIGDKLKVDWDKLELSEFKKGLEVEQEHRDLIGNSLEKAGKIALAHLREKSDYYTRLKKAGL